jgi:excisionase family DNA binding protein
VAVTLTLLKIKEAAARLRVSERTVWRRIGDGNLTGVRLSRSATRVTEESVTAFITRRTTDTAPAST